MNSIIKQLGKIAIDDNILRKPGKLTEEKFSVIKKRNVLGSEIIKKEKGT